MANGSRGKAGGRRSEETRVGSLDEDEREEAPLARGNETRVARVEDLEEPETLPPTSTAPTRPRWTRRFARPTPPWRA